MPYLCSVDERDKRTVPNLNTHNTYIMSIKIGANFVMTSNVKLHEVRNNMQHTFYYQTKGRIFHENKHTYIRVKFIFRFDLFVVQEYYDKEYVTKKDIKEYARVMSESFTDSVKDWDNLDEFFTFCKNSIYEYNK